MLKQIARLRFCLVLLSGILLFCSSAVAMEVLSKQDNRRDNRGDRHYYRDGRWYRHDSSGHEIAVTVLGNGAFVESLPPQHTTIVVQGAQYYHDDRYYYRQHPNGGYVVVPAPAQINYNNRGARGDNSRNEVNRGQNH